MRQLEYKGKNIKIIEENGEYTAYIVGTSQIFFSDTEESAEDLIKNYIDNMIPSFKESYQQPYNSNELSKKIGIIKSENNLLKLNRYLRKYHYITCDNNLNMGIDNKLIKNHFEIIRDLLKKENSDIALGKYVNESSKEPFSIIYDANYYNTPNKSYNLLSQIEKDCLGGK